jgi:hypothetical protein
MDFSFVLSLFISKYTPVFFSTIFIFFFKSSGIYCWDIRLFKLFSNNDFLSSINQINVSSSLLTHFLKIFHSEDEADGESSMLVFISFISEYNFCLSSSPKSELVSNTLENQVFSIVSSIKSRLLIDSLI